MTAASVPFPYERPDNSEPRSICVRTCLARGRDRPTAASVLAYGSLRGGDNGERGAVAYSASSDGNGTLAVLS